MSDVAKRLLSAWGWYVAGAISVLLGLWLYARRYGFELEVSASGADESEE